MTPLLLSSKPYYEQYATSNNFNTNQFDNNEGDRGQGRNGRHPPPHPPPQFDDNERRRGQGWNGRPPPHPPPWVRDGYGDRSRRRSYSPRSRHSRWHPYSRDGKRALTCELNLGSKKSHMNGPGLRPRTDTWPDLSSKASTRILERLNILASTTYSDEQGEAVVDMQCDADKKNQEAHFIHWLHIQRPEMDLEEFERLALQSPGISDEMALVVSDLMKKVRKELEKNFVHGRYMLPGTFRCDGRDTSQNDKEDISAVWMCMPYFSMELSHQNRSADSSTLNLHPLRTLLQSCYDFESTQERDYGHHAHLKTRGRSKMTAHLPQLWCLVLGSETIITSAQADLNTISSTGIFRTNYTGESDRAGLVKVIDPYMRQFFFPIKSCRTLFEMKQIVSQQCLEDIYLDVEYYDFVHNKEILNGQTWMEIVRTEKSLIVTISVVEKKGTENSREDGDLAVLLNLDYGGSRRRSYGSRSSVTNSEVESSGSSTEEEVELDLAQRNKGKSRGTILHNVGNNQLITIRPRGSPSPRRRSKERRMNAKKVQKLTRSGLIVNEPDSVAVEKKVKMYRIEPEGEASNSHSSAKNPSPHDSSARTHQSSKQAYVSDEPENTPERYATVTNIDEIPNQPEARKPAKTPKLSLRAPPCFTWNLEGSGEKTDELNSSHNSSSSAGLKHILSRLQTKISKSDYDLMGKHGRIYEEEGSFEGGRFYSETPNLSLDELKMLKRPLKDTLSSLRHRRTLILEGLRLGPAASSSKPGFVHQTRSKDDFFVLQQKIELHVGLQKILSLAEDLIACFAPLSYDHALLAKIWGSLGSLMTIISEDGAYDSDSNTNPTTSSKRQDLKNLWRIKFISDEEATVLSSTEAKILLPSKSHANCDECRYLTIYTSLDDATKHFVSEHYGDRALTKPQREAISIFIRSAEQVRVDALNKTRFNILKDCLEHLELVTSRAKEIVEVVAGAIDDTADGRFAYFLPRTLVRAFQHSSISLLATSHAIRLVDDHFDAEKWTLQRDEPPGYRPLIAFLGVRADIAMTNAIKDVILMVRTGETSESVNYSAVGPRYIALVMYKNLLTRNVAAQTGLVDIYKKSTSQLQYDVYHKSARRRVLGQIQLVHEEVSAALAVQQSQIDTICHFGWVGQAESFRISNQFRNQQYGLEIDIGQNCIDQLESDLTDLDLLLRRLNRLEQKLRYRIDVLEEDNSKAIFIFTVVAAIFLPLSFFTSYLGMNTADIRDMTNSQSTFWAVALPVTAGVVSLAILAAYKGDSLHEWLFERRERRQTKERTASGNREKSYNGSGDDAEKMREGGKKRARFSNSPDGKDDREDIV